MRTFSLSSVMMLFVLSSACATKVEGLYVSDSFQSSALKKEGLATGGVVNAKAAQNRSESNQYSALLLSEIKDERSFVALQPVEKVIQAMGEAEYNGLLAQYQSSGLDAAALGKVAAKIPGVRFVAFAKIESDLTEKGESRQAASESKDEKGQVTKVPESITKTHKRTVLASLHIYDLNKKDLAFSGQVSKTKENSKNYTVNAIGNVLSVVNAVQGKSDESTYPTPNAPGTRDVLADVFEGFAENFPKE